MKKSTRGPWVMLNNLIQRYADARVAESWQVGGDPADHSVLELRLKLARSELATHIEKMQRESQS